MGRTEWQNMDPEIKKRGMHLSQYSENLSTEERLVEIYHALKAIGMEVTPLQHYLMKEENSRPRP